MHDIRDTSISVLSGSLAGLSGTFDFLLRTEVVIPDQIQLAFNALIGATISWIAVEILKYAKKELEDVVFNRRTGSPDSNESERQD